MKRKLDTGHYTFSSGGEDDFSSLMSNVDNQGCNSAGYSACHGYAISPTGSLHFTAPTAFGAHSPGRAHLLS